LGIKELHCEFFHKVTDSVVANPNIFTIPNPQKKNPKKKIDLNREYFVI